jgi:hypothetical protein
MLTLDQASIFMNSKLSADLSEMGVRFHLSNTGQVPIYGGTLSLFTTDENGSQREALGEAKIELRPINSGAAHLHQGGMHNQTFT